MEDEVDQGEGKRREGRKESNEGLNMFHLCYMHV
jgi:hypothetical protein